MFTATPVFYVNYSPLFKITEQSQNKIVQMHPISVKSLKISKGVIRIHISKKNKQHNDQKKKYKRTKKDLHKTKDRVTRTPLNPEVNSGAPEGKAVPAPLVSSVVLI